MNLQLKICNHPCLVRPELPNLLEYSPKLLALKDLLKLTEVVEEAGGNHKALIFSQKKSMLNIIEHELLNIYYTDSKYLRLDGTTPAEMRVDKAEAFNQDPNIRLMLLTTNVGGLGLNLTAADIVIFIDHD